MQQPQHGNVVSSFFQPPKTYSVPQTSTAVLLLRRFGIGSTVPQPKSVRRKTFPVSSLTRAKGQCVAFRLVDRLRLREQDLPPPVLLTNGQRSAVTRVSHGYGQ